MKGVLGSSIKDSCEIALAWWLCVFAYLSIRHYKIISTKFPSKFKETLPLFYEFVHRIIYASLCFSANSAKIFMVLV